MTMDYVFAFVLGAAAVKAVPAIDVAATKIRNWAFARIRKFRANPGLE